MANKDAGNEICSFLEKKSILLEQYLFLSKKMKDFCGDDGNSSLGSLVSKRQECINKIEKIDLSISRIVKEGSDKIFHISKKFKGMIDHYLSNIRSVVVKVEQLDGELMVMIKEEGDSIKAEILKMQNARQAVRGYGRGIKYPSKLLNTRS